MSQGKKLFIALVVGFVFSAILMGVVIYIGFTNAYSTNVPTLTVDIFELPIYEITKTGTGYIGKSMEKNMGSVCLSCMGGCYLLIELICKIRKK